MTFTLYTDGSVTNNGMPNSFGGWAWVLVDDQEDIILSKYSGMEAPTTNNRMEMMAVIDGLEYWHKTLAEHHITIAPELRIIADSKYVLDAFRQDWISGWRLRGWRNANNKPVANKDLWLRLIELVEKIGPKFEHVHGHTGHIYNELCDKLAGEASRSKL